MTTPPSESPSMPSAVVCYRSRMGRLMRLPGYVRLCRRLGIPWRTVATLAWGVWAARRAE